MQFNLSELDENNWPSLKLFSTRDWFSANFFIHMYTKHITTHVANYLKCTFNTADNTVILLDKPFKFLNCC